ncbi:hypothetical protein ANCCEY_08111 [Ancylostoma ceylanicum]|uniref:OTU domain-containing protein n=1 Tax=Ancylostoma ceylanicum TaxID=53326 RepID=A0A0D6LS20_9BILA|nr:hypothetical protein ANCCEY_08111 [Ancylostoma ceylanicum]
MQLKVEACWSHNDTSCVRIQHFHNLQAKVMTLQVLDSISFRRESRVGTLEASDATANNASSPSPCRRFVGDAMDKYLASIGLVKKMMANEKGSSVFRAVCESLAMDQSEYLGLKELVDDELLMRYRLQRLRTGLPEVNKIEDTLAAVVRALRIDIHVYRAVGEEPHIYRCAKRGKKRVEKVLLCESARGHFDLVYPLKDHVNLAYAQNAVGTDIQTPSPLSSQSYSDQRFSFKPNDFDDKPSTPVWRPPIPYSAVKALDPSVYRNVAYDLFSKERKRELEEIDEFQPGTPCCFVEEETVYDAFVMAVLDRTSRLVMPSSQNPFGDEFSPGLPNGSVPTIQPQAYSAYDYTYSSYYYGFQSPPVRPSSYACGNIIAEVNKLARVQDGRGY